MIQREIEDRSLHLADWFTGFNQAIDLMEHCFINPNLAACGADLGRDVLKEVEPIASTFLVGDYGWS